MKLVFALSCVLASLCSGQTFTPVEVLPESVGAPGPRPLSGTLLRVATDALRAQLAAAPMERLDLPLDAYGSGLTLVDPDGREVECFVAESPIMEPGLAAQFPEMRTYIVRSVDRSASGRIEITQRGLTGMLRVVDEAAAATGGSWMIDLWQARDDAHVISYWLRELPGGGDWTCHTPSNPGAPIPADPPAYGERAFQSRREYRLAVACTGEYGVHHSTLQGREPNVADPLAAIVTVVSRTNVVYEADLGVHFNLVANNNLLVFIDPATDPYPSSCDGGAGSDCSSPVLGANYGAIESRIGVANFDIGHCVTRIFGGVANLACVCTANKAGGVSGIPRGGDADPFSALVVIHEIGHQFGANHTFSGIYGRCAGNVSLATAWEAGSGSTPMAYAGACPVGGAPPSDNIVEFADPFFHHGSIAEMQSFIAGTGRTCSVTTATSNQVPVFSTVARTYSIPPSTPFELVAAATDADGDTLSYSWEQFDPGVARPLSGTGAVDNGSGALFRVFPPVPGSSRWFPQASDVLAGVATPGERLPTFANRTRRFRCIVRDNNPAAGAVAISPIINIVVNPGSSRFFISSPAANARVSSGVATVVWSVGNTTGAPISAASVVLDLSLDNGVTWSTTLGTFPNTGTAQVQLPQGITPAARIRITAPGKIFFNISGRFRIGCPADYNDDNAADADDVIAFFGLWDASDPSADFNADGGVDGDDTIAFFAAWDSGC
ncbi:MAG: reprolysin-like metallopeptidase [Phycisphaerales bacterium]